MPTSLNSQFEIIMKNKAAIKIQSAWRIHHAHQSQAQEQKQQDAAAVIQRAVRCWRRKQCQQSQTLLWNGIPYERRKRINETIKMWRLHNGNVKLCGLEQAMEISNEVQRQFSDWRKQAPNRENRIKRIESLSAQVETSSLILEGSKSLTDFQPTDTGFYWCSSVALAVEARLRLKQMLLSFDEMWGKKIETQDNGDN